MRSLARSKETRKSTLVTLILIAISLIFPTTLAMASDWTFQPIDVPDAIQTVANDINSRGDIVGVYTGIDKKVHGYLLSQGNLTTIDFPSSKLTRAYGINAQGDIVGVYSDSASHSHGFLLHEGTFTSIDFPGSTYTDAWGISSDGNIAGTYTYADGASRAYRRTQQGDFVALDPPFNFTSAMTHGLNSRGEMVGCWWDTYGTMHSLLLKGTYYMTNDFPGSAMSMNYRINERDWMVGYYVDKGSVTHGYMVRGINYASFDFPGATYTDARGINNLNEIVGTYTDSSKKTHGYLLIGNEDDVIGHEPRSYLLP